MGASESSMLAVEERVACFKRGPELTTELYRRHRKGEELPGLLTVVPDCLTYRTCLYRALDLSFNLLQDLPSDLPLTLPHLVSLNLSHNRLSSIPDSIFGFLHLRELNVSFNNLSELPPSICLLDKLRKMNASDNQISRLPPGVEQLQSLEKLNLLNNPLQHIPLALGGLPRLLVVLAPPPHPRPLLPHLRACHAAAMAAKSGQDSRPQVNTFPRVRGPVFDSKILNAGSAQSLFSQMQAQAVQTGNRLLTPLIPPLGASTLDAERLGDVLAGMVWGLVIGDTLGQLTVGLDPEEAEFHYCKENLGLVRGVPDEKRVLWDDGQPSPVTHLALATLDSVLTWGGVIDELDYMERLRQWWNAWGEASLSKTLVNILKENSSAGLQLVQVEKQAAPVLKVEDCQEQGETEEQDIQPQSHDAEKTHAGGITEKGDGGEKSEEDREDCYCLPPMVGLAVAQFHDLNEVRSNALRICEATHKSLEAREGATKIAVLLARILQGKGLEQVLDMGSHSLNRKQRCKEDKVENSGPNTSSGCFAVLDRVIAAAQDFEEAGFKGALTKVVMEGGSATVGGAVAGAVFGALAGYSNLPASWLGEVEASIKEAVYKRINHLLDLMGIP